MARKKKTPAKPAPKTVKLDAVVPPPVVTPLAAPTKTATISTPADKVPAGEVVKKAELIDRAVEMSGLKKRDVKPSVEAAMAVLSEALIKGEELNLPPLGKLRVVKSKDVNDGAKVLTLKLRTMKDSAGKGGKADMDPPKTAPTKTAPTIKLEATKPAPVKKPV